MAVPIIHMVNPTSGPTVGGDIVRLTGAGFAPRVAVQFGQVSARILSVREDVVEVWSPAHEEFAVDIQLQNLDADGMPIPGEVATVSEGYRFLRPRIVQESNLTRLVRALLRELKRQVIENVSMRVALDYDDGRAEGIEVVPIAELPSLVLSGPRVSENRFYSCNVPQEDVVGREVLRRKPSWTVDLTFTLTAASDRLVELLNLMTAVASFLNRNRWVALPRDPDEPLRGDVRWEMNPVGEFRTHLNGPDGIRVFNCDFVVLGFDIDEGMPLDLSWMVSETQVDLKPVPTK